MEVPEQPGEVQKDFKLGKTGKYVLSIKVCAFLEPLWVTPVLLSQPIPSGCCS